MRGAKFYVLTAFHGVPPQIRPTDSSVDICNDALKHVAEWLQFSDTGEYLNALEEEKQQIFLRAKD